MGFRNWNWTCSSISGVCSGHGPNSPGHRVHESVNPSYGGMLFHSSSRALVNWARVAGGGWRSRTCLSNWSHRCSIGDKSGLYGGQSSGWTLLFAWKTWQILATWGLALSCCRVRLCCCKKGITWGRRISSLYLAAVKLPSITTNCDFNPCEIPPHTITDPPPNISLSTTQASMYKLPAVRSIKAESRLVCEENLSPLPQWKPSWNMCCDPGHTTLMSSRGKVWTYVGATCSCTKFS